MHENKFELSQSWGHITLTQKKTNNESKTLAKEKFKLISIVILSIARGKSHLIFIKFNKFHYFELFSFVSFASGIFLKS